VLSTLELAAEQRRKSSATSYATQSRLEATLTALERLAQGELTTVDDFRPFDITDCWIVPPMTRFASTPT